MAGGRTEVLDTLSVCGAPIEGAPVVAPVTVPSSSVAGAAVGQAWIGSALVSAGVSYQATSTSAPPVGATAGRAAPVVHVPCTGEPQSLARE